MRVVKAAQGDSRGSGGLNKDDMILLINGKFGSPGIVGSLSTSYTIKYRIDAEKILKGEIFTRLGLSKDILKKLFPPKEDTTEKNQPKATEKKATKEKATKKKAKSYGEKAKSY